MEVRFPLKPQPPLQRLCWQMPGGKVVPTELDIKYYHTLMKRPAARPKIVEAQKKKDEEEEEEEPQGEEEEVEPCDEVEEDDKEEQGETRKKPPTGQRMRVIKKRPASQVEKGEMQNFQVGSIYMVRAQTGKCIRSYLLAVSVDKTSKKQLVQVTPNESRKYHQVCEKLKEEAEAKLIASFAELRAWADKRKREVLA